MRLTCVAFLLAGLVALIGADICEPESLFYAFTPCDRDDTRWMLTGHRHKNATCATLPARQVPCTIECASGEFLPLGGIQCAKCPRGTFSEGGGEQFSTWKALPKIFSTAHTGDCGRWTTNGTFVQSAARPGGCKSVLTLDVSLKKSGFVKFRYLVDYSYVPSWLSDSGEPTRSTFAYVTINGDSSVSCLSDESTGQRKELMGSTSVPLTKEIALAAGHNSVSWVSQGRSEYGWPAPLPLRVVSVQVQGTDYAGDCFLCPKGTYSRELGSTECFPCAPGHFANTTGMSACLTCAHGSTSQSGASECVAFGVCSAADTLVTYSPCTTLGTSGQLQRTVSWQWKTLLSCYIDTTVYDKPATRTEACPLCPPGMELSATAAAGCSYCPVGTHSPGGVPCIPCPPHTAALRVYDLSRWPSLPPNARTWCQHFSYYRCNGWIPGTDGLSSGIGIDSTVEVVLQVNASIAVNDNGDRGGLVQVNISSIVCAGVCQLSVVASELLSAPSDQARSLSIGSHSGALSEPLVLEGSLPTGEWSLQVVFSKINAAYDSWDDEEIVDTNDNWVDYDDEYDEYNGRRRRYADPSLDHAVISAIFVGDTTDGGAARCTECPLGTYSLANSVSDRCFTCDAGKVYSERAQSCVLCPENTYKPEDEATLIECRACGAGLSADRGATKCISSCVVDIASADGPTSQIDLTQLDASPVLFDGPLQFTETGVPYNLRYALRLCHEPTGNNETCHDVTTGRTAGDAHMCTVRMETTHAGRTGSVVVARDPMSLGDRLDSLTVAQDSHTNRTALTFHYVHGSVSIACPSRFSSIVTLFCALDEGTGTPELVSATPCTRVFEWYTASACRSCTWEDYTNVTSACMKGGLKKVSYVWKTYPPKCAGGVRLPAPHMVTCTWLEQSVVDLKWVGVGVAGTVLVLVVVIVALWRRNRNLEYKYTRLEEDAKTGQFPAAETCGMGSGSDDEEEEEDEAGVGLKGRKPLKQKIARGMRSLGRRLKGGSGAGGAASAKAGDGTWDLDGFTSVSMSGMGNGQGEAIAMAPLDDSDDDESHL